MTDVESLIGHFTIMSAYSLNDNITECLLAGHKIIVSKKTSPKINLCNSGVMIHLLQVSHPGYGGIPMEVCSELRHTIMASSAENS